MRRQIAALLSCLILAPALGVVIVACSDSAAVCGDGAVDLGEECDDGNTTDADACLASCVAALPTEPGTEFPTIEKTEEPAGDMTVKVKVTRPAVATPL